MNAQELIAHYDSVLAVNEWILCNHIAWTVVEPIDGLHSVQQIGDALSGVHDFHLEEVHVKEGMEDDEESPRIFLDFYEGGYFFFDTYDITGTQERLASLLGESSFIWGIRWEAGAVQHRLFYSADGQVQMSTTNVLRDPKLDETTALAENIAAVRSAWWSTPGRYQDSALLALISLTSGALLSSDWLNSTQNALVTENLRGSA
ncbi:hypothetical protein SAMN05216276_1002313 [Streptosporangium subroseum]|uniref:Uncharacterized protein n=1 Tax=Streptosporangium subroseum TaxID=106412 RepID=A0A239B2I1_9ACTN|nr:hypothetical protein [Streptosporangium subroseum]SNS02010.1 hypothetical protein SAMN05216276_1002313 [Streptosporangium subroseum]